MTHTIPPCADYAELFDSIDMQDHLAARVLCDDCPLRQPCAARAAEVAEVGGYFGQPEGTWAGVLLIEKRRAEHAEANRRARERTSA